MLSCTSEFPNNRPYHLPILLIISVITHVPFVLSGFGEIDATKIAVSVIDLLNNGPNAAFANFYFSDVIPLYILYLKSLMKVLDNNYSYLPSVMNYTNAVFGILTVIPAYILIKRLFRNSTIAFCTVLALIFAPSYYQATIMGFPHLIAFFFVLVSLVFYLSGIDCSKNSKIILMMFLSCLFLTIAFLFKSDIVLAAGVFIGILFMRKIKSKWKISSAFIIILLSGILFLLFRSMILEQGSGTTMSKEGLSRWYDYSLIIPSTLNYFIRQTKPIAYGAGLATFFLGIFTFLFYIFKKRMDIVIFIVSWAAVPTAFWMVMIGNNARHNMITVLPLLAIIIVFIYERSPKYVTLITVFLIGCNFFITPPSYSILTPSGNLFASTKLLEERMNIFYTDAKDIASIDEKKIAVLGYFHNPHVIFEIMRSTPSYKAYKIGREDYKLRTGDKEYVFIYFVAAEPEALEKGVNKILSDYQLRDYLFVSVTYDLQPLIKMGLRATTPDIIKREGL